jgi:YjbE family integral membrane protein
MAKLDAVIARLDFAAGAPGDNFPMEILSLDFVSALAAIVVIDLMLAGDNAIVIALAARNVPAHLQKRAIAWGTVGAIVVRSLMTLIVVWLLKIPGLLFAGGAVLIWIAYKLLLPDASDAHEGAGEPKSPTSFWAAMRTIVIADAVMGLDNVLAVAGAAHGSYILVVLGLLISVPIVVWGSSVLLKWVERYPVIVYFGAAVLAYTAVKMMVHEPLLRDSADEQAYLVILFYGVVIIGVIYAGFVRNHRVLESRIHARLKLMSAALAQSRPEPSSPEKGRSMKTVLVPIGDRNAEFAVRRVIAEYLKHADLQIHLLNVQMPLSRHIAQFVRRGLRDDFHREKAEVALEPARKLLAQHNIPYDVHIRVGDRASVIADEAQRLGADHIVMSTARKDSLTRMLEDSTTNKLLELTPVPVEVVAGEKISRMERYGVPSAIGAALALIVAAAMD